MEAMYDEMKSGRKGDKNFVSMAAAYSLGVFNDNFFKQAAMLLAVGAGLGHLQGTATVVFALPFILFSAYAGWLADRFPKKNVVVHGKVLELFAMLIGAYGMVTMNWTCILAMIFLMGLQSSIFGPALNGSIPEHFPQTDITSINGTLKMITTISILVGIACAGLVLDIQGLHGIVHAGRILIAIIVVMVSVLGLAAALGMKKYEAAAPAKSFCWAGPLISLAHLWSLRHDRSLLLAVISNAFFYFLATLAILIVNTFGVQQLGFSQSLTSLLNVSLMVGVATGSFCVSRFIRVEHWKRVLLPGSIAMGCGLLAAAGTSCLHDGLQSILLLASLILTGISGGLFVIPVASFIQVRPLAKDKGQVLAVAGFCSFVGILLAGQVYSVLETFMLPGMMLVCAGGMSLVAAACYFSLRIMSQHAIRKILARLILGIVKLRYSIQVKGLDRIDQDSDGKSILFLPNHPALIDPVFLVSILYDKFQPRPLADHDHTDRFYIRPVLRLINAIRIPNIASNGRETREQVRSGIDAVIKGLDRGDNILLYPAGRLYRSRYEKLGATSAVHTILQHNPDQRIVLVRTHGLWGSSFSWVHGRPQPLREWRSYLRYVFGNLIFLGPRRRVTIDFQEADVLPRQANRLEINRALEEFYNTGSLPNSYVPYFWWQGRSPVSIPEPEERQERQTVANIPESTRSLVTQHIQQIAGVPQVKEKDMLAHDIGLDSLTVMELAVWVEEEFGLPVEDIEAMQTVGDVMLAACGQLGGGRAEKTRAVPDRWFAERSEQELQLPGEKNIAYAFLRKASLRPDTAIVADEISGVKTYRELITAIMIIQKRLQKLEGDTVGIMLPASVSATIVYFATIFAGKIPVMLNWTIGAGQMQHCIQTAGVSQVVTAKALIDKLKGQGIDVGCLEVEWLHLEQMRQEISLSEKVAALVRSYVSWASLRKARVQDKAVILFTSGSEAKPKAVPLSHANILSNLRDFHSVLSFRKSDRLLGMLPPFHSLGLAGTVIMPLCLGLRTTYHANPTEGGTVARLIGRYKSTLLIGTPTFVNGILRSASPGQLDSLRLIFTGAEKCPDYVYESVGERLPNAVLCEGYGITECSPVVSVNTPLDPRPGTIGRILPGMEYLVVDPEETVPVAPGQRGILLVRGGNVFSGYLHGQDSPFITIDGKQWYNTGDIVSEGEDGVLTFRGRIKRFIKLGGEMISLPAIETALQKYFPAGPDGEPALAVEATASEHVPEVVLFTTLNVDREEINACLRKAGLSALHNIRRLVSVDSIPVLGTGKIDYRQLKVALS